MKYDIISTSRFKKDYKLLIKRGANMNELHRVIELLRDNKPLPEKYHDHALSGNYAGYRECHIRPDWLLIYLVDNNVLVLTLTRTGSHSDLFG